MIPPDLSARGLERPSAEELIRRYQGQIWRFLRLLGADSAQADDLTQETFLCVLQQPMPVMDVAATGAYLRTVARHALLRIRRKSAPEAVDQAQLEHEFTRFCGEDGGEEALAALRVCLQSLEVRAREALDRHYRDRWSRAQIGQALGMSEDGIKSLMRRARTVLRACIERRLQR